MIHQLFTTCAEEALRKDSFLLVAATKVASSLLLLLLLSLLFLSFSLNGSPSLLSSSLLLSSSSLSALKEMPQFHEAALLMKHFLSSEVVDICRSRDSLAEILELGANFSTLEFESVEDEALWRRRSLADLLFRDEAMTFCPSMSCITGRKGGALLGEMLPAFREAALATLESLRRF